MADFESKFLFNHPIQPTLYRRYLDDMFFIWQHPETQFNELIHHLNSVHDTIKFTHSTSRTNVTYLDLDIYISNNKLHTQTHFKSTNTFLYLHGKSNHPPSTFKGVYMGENITILRNTIHYNSIQKRRYPSHLTNPFQQKSSISQNLRHQLRRKLCHNFWSIYFNKRYTFGRLAKTFHSSWSPKHIQSTSYYYIQTFKKLDTTSENTTSESTTKWEHYHGYTNLLNSNN